MIKKVIIGLSIFLVILVVISIVLFSNSRQKKNELNQAESSQSVTSQTNKVKKYVKKVPTSAQEQFLTGLKSSGSQTNDFSITYSSPMGKYIIEKKSAQADQAIQAWALRNGVSDLLYNPDYFLLSVDNQLVTYSNEPKLHVNPAIQALSPLLQSQIATLTNHLPYSSQNLSLIYSASADKFIAEIKTPTGQAELNDWATENQAIFLTENSDILFTSDLPPERVIPTLTFVANIPTPTGNFTEESMNSLRDIARIAQKVLPPISPVSSYPAASSATGVPGTNPTTPIVYPTIDPQLPNQIQTVYQIVNSIKSNCSGPIDVNTYPCLYKVPLLTSEARYLLIQSAKDWSQGNYSAHLVGLQCVGFVRAMAKQTTGVNVLESGDASSQLRPQSGYKVVYNTAQNRPNIKPGDIPVWSTNHIAYVVRVIDNQRGVVEVAEANIIPGEVGLRSVPLSNPAISGWLTP